MVNAITEQGIVEKYMLHVYTAKETVRNELTRKGYEPEEVARLSLDMAIEVNNHFQMGKEIAEKRMKKAPDNDPMEDYRQIFQKVDRMFGGKAYVIRGGKDSIDAFYNHDNDVYGLSEHAFAECSVGHGEIYRTHEGRHECQRKIHGRLLGGSYTEGDAELHSIEEMSRLGETKQLIKSYIGLLQVSAKAERMMRENVFATGRAEADYNQYVLSPAVIFHLKDCGKTDEEILRHYERANEKIVALGVKQALLEGLE